MFTHPLTRLYTQRVQTVSSLYNNHLEVLLICRSFNCIFILHLAHVEIILATLIFRIRLVRCSVNCNIALPSLSGPTMQSDTRTIQCPLQVKKWPASLSCLLSWHVILNAGCLSACYFYRKIYFFIHSIWRSQKK